MATNTYVAIDKVTVGTATSSVVFSSIPSGYTDLVIVFECFTTAAGARDVAVRFNGDTASNYSSTFFQGNGSAATSTRESSQTRMMIDYSGAGTTSSTAEIGIVNIMNYSNATTNKTVLVRANRAGAGTDAVVGLWRNTAAITSVTLMFINGTDNFGVGSVFSLYGILAEGGAKATGGVVTSDSTYYYHTFLASGTFTPLSTLSCEYLIIGGGAGGARTGGGGSGVISYSSGNSVSTAKTVTVGGGGAGANTSAGIGTSGVTSSVDVTTAVGGTGGRGITAATNPAQGGAGGGNSGGAGGAGVQYQGGGGGGGAGSNGTAGTYISGNDNNPGGAGGTGSNAYSLWATATSTGNSGFYSSGGGGGGGWRASGTPFGAGGTASAGGGGAGGAAASTTAGSGIAGLANTGGGGGAGGVGGVTDGAGATGGSGIVIVRYAK